MYQYDKLQAPLYLIGGLYDGYKDFTLNIQQGVKAAKRHDSSSAPFVKVAIGPWEHSWPDDSGIGPCYDGRGEAVRWFDYWLKGKNSSVVSEPDLAVFVRDYNAPSLEVSDDGIRGKWSFIQSWPPADSESTRLYPSSDHTMKGSSFSSSSSSSSTSLEDSRHELEYNATAGVEAGTWWGDLTEDQANLDHYCLVYDYVVNTEDSIVIVGFANVSLRTSIDASTDHANWIVRLEDVHPNGSVTLVTGGLINGALREPPRTSPIPLEREQVYVLKFRLHFTTWTFHPGHSIRVSISNALFRVIWPSPKRFTMTLFVDDPDTWIQLPHTTSPLDDVPAFTKRPPQYGPEDYRSDDDAVDYDFGGYPITQQTVWDERKQRQVVYWVGEEWWNIRNVLISAFTSQRFEANRLSPATSEWSFCAAQTYVYGVPLTEDIEVLSTDHKLKLQLLY